MKLFQRLPAAHLASLLRRLAVQGAMSAVVMAGLHAASGSGAAFKEWLAAPNDGIAAGEPAAPAEGPRFTFVAIPAGEALPRRELAGPVPLAPSLAAQRPPAEGEARETQTGQIAQAEAQRNIAVPTPRPMRVAVAEPRPVPPSMQQQQPADLPFDLSARQPAGEGSVRTTLPDAPELVADAATVPEPGETASSTFAGLLPFARIPSGEGLLRSAGDVTIIASDAVVGTASRVLDLVR